MSPVWKNGQLLPQLIENTTSEISRFPVRFRLTSYSRHAYNPQQMEEQAITVKPKGKNGLANFPVRFRNKTQKERFERAARKSGKSLNQFLLDNAELAVSQLDQKAS